MAVEVLERPEVQTGCDWPFRPVISISRETIQASEEYRAHTWQCPIARAANQIFQGLFGQEVYSSVTLCSDSVDNVDIQVYSPDGTIVASYIARGCGPIIAEWDAGGGMTPFDIEIQLLRVEPV